MRHWYSPQLPPIVILEGYFLSIFSTFPVNCDLGPYVSDGYASFEIPFLLKLL